MILSELPPKYWTEVLLQNRHICYLYYLPALRFGCLQLSPFISPDVLQGGENWGWPDLITFILFNQQKKYKRKSPRQSHNWRTVESPWKKGGHRKVGTGNKGAAHLRSRLAWQSPRSAIWGMLQVYSKMKESPFLVTVGKTLWPAYIPPVFPGLGVSHLALTLEGSVIPSMKCNVQMLPNTSLSSMAIKSTCNYEQFDWWGLRALFEL